jgi:hypothetical protein
MDLFENPKFFGERGLMRMDRGIAQTGTPQRQRRPVASRQE